MLKFGLSCSSLSLLQSYHHEILLHHHSGDALHPTFMVNALFPGFHVFLFLLTSLFWWGISSSKFLGSKNFEALNMWKHISSTLTYICLKTEFLVENSEFWRHCSILLLYFSTAFLYLCVSTVLSRSLMPWILNFRYVTWFAPFFSESFKNLIFITKILQCHTRKL